MADMRATILKVALDRQKEQRQSQQKMLEKQQDYKLKLDFEKQKAKIKSQYVPASQEEEIPGFRRTSVTREGQRFERIVPESESQSRIEGKAIEQGMFSAGKERALATGKMRRGEVLLNNIESLWKETKPPSVKKSIAGYPTFGYGKGVSQFFGAQKTESDRATKAYLDFVGGIRAQLARTIGGDVGNLSEYEQKAILTLMPVASGLRADFFETGSKKLLKLRQTINDIYQARVSGYKDLKEYYSANGIPGNNLIPMAEVPPGYKKQTNKRTGETRLVPI